MKLSTYAKLNNITYRTAWEHFRKGLISNARQLVTGTVVIDEPMTPSLAQENTVAYCRVSSSENKANLGTQAERVCGFCAANGWVVGEVIREVGSGMNDSRPKLLKILTSKPTRIVVEHKDRLTRFGFNYLSTLLRQQGCEIVVINKVETNRDDLMQDFVSVVTSFCARLYGQRRSKRATIKLIGELNNANPK